MGLLVIQKFDDDSDRWDITVQQIESIEQATDIGGSTDDLFIATYFEDGDPVKIEVESAQICAVRGGEAVAYGDPDEDG